MRSKQGGEGSWCGVSAGRAVAVAMVVLTGCSLFHNPELRRAEQQAYEQHLEQTLRGYSHDMRCEALLPLVEDLLWDKGYEQVESVARGDGLITEWNDARRYEVHAHRIGLEQCAVDIVQTHRDDGRDRQYPDPKLELQLIERIDASDAERIRTDAERNASEAVSQ